MHTVALNLGEVPLFDNHRPTTLCAEFNGLDSGAAYWHALRQHRQVMPGIYAGCLANGPGSASVFSPPRHNSCRPDKIENLGAVKREQVGALRKDIQGQSGGTVAAAGERIS
jgi:hypothetical protein